MCAIMQADTMFWQLRSVATPPYFHCGHSPMPPGKVYFVPFWSRLTSVSFAASAHLTR